MLGSNCLAKVEIVMILDIFWTVFPKQFCGEFH